MNTISMARLLFLANDMKTTLIIIFGLLITCPVLAQSEEIKLVRQNQDSIITGPFMKFEEKSHDFGDIIQGDKVNYSFIFKNTGTAPLIITNVLTTCGCTAPNWPREPIPPGSDNKIEITFDSKGKSGRQNKVITILSNGPQKRVNIIANVLPRPGENQVDN